MLVAAPHYECLCPCVPRPPPAADTVALHSCLIRAPGQATRPQRSPASLSRGPGAHRVASHDTVERHILWIGNCCFVSDYLILGRETFAKNVTNPEAGRRPSAGIRAATLQRRAGPAWLVRGGPGHQAPGQGAPRQPPPSPRAEGSGGPPGQGKIGSARATGTRRAAGGCHAVSTQNRTDRH